MLKRYDILIIIFFLLIAIFLFLFNYTKKEATLLKVYVQNREIMKKRIDDLENGKKIEIEGILGISVFEYVRGKGVHMVLSPCPDKLCIRQGFIKKIGESIVCLPNRVVITLEAEK